MGKRMITNETPNVDEHAYFIWRENIHSNLDGPDLVALGYRSRDAEVDALKGRAAKLEEALRAYLQAGHKEARREASVLAKQALALEVP